MPLHVFKCSKGHETERIMSFAKAEITERIVCSECAHLHPAKSTVDWALRQLSAPAIIFKGDGFTPRFHTPAQSEIGGVPVKSGDDPMEVAKKVVANHGGSDRLLNGLVGKKKRGNKQ